MAPGGRKQNTKVLKDLMVELGPIHYREGNEGAYLADFVTAEKKFYPYRDAVSILQETHPVERNVQEADNFGALFRAQSTETF
jgi:hypothetical protein